jgi:translation initiation factor 2 subunit 3
VGVEEVKTKNLEGEKGLENTDSKAIDQKLIPNANIGMVGHVAHGKTTLTEALTGKLTLTHSEELKRGITIRLGYADARIYKCVSCNRYFTSDKPSGARCPYCLSDSQLQRTVSFVDVPGHETLMATVLTGAALMDGAILVIAANERCPQPQTREHLTALEAVGIKSIIIVQNKIDLVDEKRAMESYREIKEFVKGTNLEDAPIIPVSAQKKANIDVVVEMIEKMIQSSALKEGDFKMLVARSFDINKPGFGPGDIRGGILGGGIVSGEVRIGDEIEIRPGVKVGDSYKSLVTKVIGLQKSGMNLEKAGTGGLLGMMTTLDPSVTKSDLLVGNVVGLPGKVPNTKSELRIEIKLLERVVGSKELAKVEPIKAGENLMINAGTARSAGVVSEFKKGMLSLKLKIPVCIEEKERVVISRLVTGRWRLIGYGTAL